jgi:pimeloyl-ACP methyl ester carboxylesterase
MRWEIGARSGTPRLKTQTPPHKNSDAVRPQCVTASHPAIVNGSVDLPPVGVAEAYRDGFQDCRLVTVEGARQFPHHTYPDEVAPVVRAVLAGSE